MAPFQKGSWMNSSELTRRDFHRLTAAAFGGVLAGAAAGCGTKEAAKDLPTPKAESTAAADAGKAEPHACRGLNSCKSDKNDCAGRATCATVSHDCAEMNSCKYLGGCGRNPGANECKGQGGCHVPMSHGDAWDRARKAFEERRKAAGKEFGPAPPAAEKKDA